MSEWYEEDVVNDPDDLDEDDIHDGNAEPDGYDLVWEMFADEDEWEDDDVDNEDSPSRQNPGYVSEDDWDGPEEPDDVQAFDDLEDAPDGAIVLADEDDDDGEQEPVVLDCDVKKSGTSVDGGTCSVGDSLTFSLVITPDNDGQAGTATVALELPQNVTCASAVDGTVTWEETFTAGGTVSVSVSGTVNAAGSIVTSCWAEYGDEHIDGWSCEVKANV